MPRKSNGPVKTSVSEGRHHRQRIATKPPGRKGAARRDRATVRASPCLRSARSISARSTQLRGAREIRAQRAAPRVEVDSQAHSEDRFGKLRREAAVPEYAHLEQRREVARERDFRARLGPVRADCALALGRPARAQTPARDPLAALLRKEIQRWTDARVV